MKIVFPLVLLFFVCACATTYQGGYAGEEIVDGTAQTTDEKVFSEIQHKPSSTKPEFKTKLNIKRTTDYTSFDTYYEERKRTKWGKYFFHFSSIYTPLSIIYGLKASSNGDYEDTKFFLSTGLIVGGLHLLNALHAPKKAKRTGNIIKKGPFERTFTDNEPTSLENFPVEIISEKRKFTKNTNSNGLLSINLVNDFKITEYKEEENFSIRLNINTPEDFKHSFSYEIDPSSWMHHFVIMPSAGVAYLFPSEKSNTAFTYNSGDQLRVTEEDFMWTEVEKEGKRGWILSGNERTIWRTSKQ